VITKAGEDAARLGSYMGINRSSYRRARPAREVLAPPKTPPGFFCRAIPILGLISLGRGITIHREDCPK